MRRQWRYRRFKKDACEECGFVASDPVQLDVHHVDGDRTNDDPSNLQTLCSNCHRVATKRLREAGGQRRRGKNDGPLKLKYPRSTIIQIWEDEFCVASAVLDFKQGRDAEVPYWYDDRETVEAYHELGMTWARSRCA